VTAEVPAGREGSGQPSFNEHDRQLHREALTRQPDLEQWRAQVWHYLGNLYLGMSVEEALAAATETVAEGEAQRVEHVAR